MAAKRGQERINELLAEVPALGLDELLTAQVNHVINYPVNPETKKVRGVYILRLNPEDMSETSDVNALQTLLRDVRTHQYLSRAKREELVKPRGNNILQGTWYNAETNETGQALVLALDQVQNGEDFKESKEQLVVRALEMLEKPTGYFPADAKVDFFGIELGLGELVHTSYDTATLPPLGGGDWEL